MLGLAQQSRYLVDTMELGWSLIQDLPRSFVFLFLFLFAIGKVEGVLPVVVSIDPLVIVHDHMQLL